MEPIKVLLSGGGTGGHIFPAVAIANEIKNTIPNAEILFVGAIGKMEMEKVPAAGYKIIGVSIAGLQRKFTLSNFKLPFLLIKSYFQTKQIIKNFNPNVVVGTGGFASGPIIKAATAKNIPALIHEGNSYAGLTNKILGKKVNKICVAYPNMDKYFPKEKILITGNPIRQDLFNINSKRNEALAFFGLNSEKKTILVIGGSLGARTINEAINLGLKNIFEANYQLIWQTGKGYISIANESVKNYKENGIKAFDFISRMDLAYAACDLVISRAGASSISEICVIGKPCILVPSPNVAEDHQTKNALALQQNSAAILVKDFDANHSLVKTALDLINDNEKLNQLSLNVVKMAYPNATKTIAAEVLKLIKKNKD
ncbi:MAG: undecaprenyldiphospho-muramoylpentapeptide beta-N-acetylglucosaminyltransferase [Bacteroidetes bacterium]|nr:undecaprenyldiphospho-muramoylpentapeptide beta-N-acetylglucosaminyltransferase [Bacteroidota bacterium]